MVFITKLKHVSIYFYRQFFLHIMIYVFIKWIGNPYTVVISKGTHERDTQIICAAIKDIHLSSMPKNFMTDSIDSKLRWQHCYGTTPGWNVLYHQDYTNDVKQYSTIIKQKSLVYWLNIAFTVEIYSCHHQKQESLSTCSLHYDIMIWDALPRQQCQMQIHLLLVWSVFDWT